MEQTAKRRRDAGSRLGASRLWDRQADGWPRARGRSVRLAEPTSGVGEAGEQIFATIVAVGFAGDARRQERTFAELVRTLMTKHGALGGSSRRHQMLVRFASPGAAVDFAAELVAASGQAGITTRAVVHSGWIGLNDQSHSQSDARDVASRLLTSIQPESLVVTQPVRDLTIGSPGRFVPTRAAETGGDFQAPPVFRLCVDGGSPDASLAEPLHRTPSTNPLSPRERQVAVLLTKGLTNRAVGEELAISAATVERHVTNILSKLAFRSRAQIAAWTIQHGLSATHS